MELITIGKNQPSPPGTPAEKKGFRLSAALRDEPGGLQERFSEKKTTAVHPERTRGQSDRLRSRQGEERRATSDGVGSRRTAAGGRTRSPSEQAKSSKTMDPWDSTGLLGGNGRPLPPPFSLSGSFVIEWSRASNAEMLVIILHPLRFRCWATATASFVSRNAGAARRHALLLLRRGRGGGLQLHPCLQPAVQHAMCSRGAFQRFFLSHRVYAG